VGWCEAERAGREKCAMIGSSLLAPDSSTSALRDRRVRDVVSSWFALACCCWPSQTNAFVSWYSGVRNSELDEEYNDRRLLVSYAKHESKDALAPWYAVDMGISTAGQLTPTHLTQLQLVTIGTISQRSPGQLGCRTL